MSLNGEPLSLSRIEFAILAYLSENTNQLVTYEEVITAVWGSSRYFDRHALEVHISRLRSKLGESGTRPHFIETVRSCGYRFKKANARAHLGSIHYDSRVRIVSAWIKDEGLFGSRPKQIVGSHWMGLLDETHHGAKWCSLGFVTGFFGTGVRQTSGRVPGGQVKSEGVNVEFISTWMDSSGVFDGIYSEFFAVQP